MATTNAPTAAEPRERQATSENGKLANKSTRNLISVGSDRHLEGATFARLHKNLLEPTDALPNRALLPAVGA